MTTRLYPLQVSQNEVYPPGTTVMGDIVLWADHKQNDEGNFELLGSF